MRLLSTFLFVCAVLEANAKYAVPFSSIAINEDGYGYTFLYVNANVGTPAQQAKLIIRTELYNASPDLAGGDQRCPDGGFDSSKSSTFVSKQGNGITGTDTFSLIKGYTHTDLPLHIFDGGCWTDTSSLSLNYSPLVPSLIADYARKQSSQVSVLAFAQAGDNNSQQTSGTLVIGDTASDLCSQDWQYLPFKEMSDGSLGWDLKIDRIKVGSLDKAMSTTMLFLLFDYSFTLPNSISSQVERILGISGEKVPCNSQTVIELSFNGNTWKFGPHTYMDLSSKDSNGMCKSRIQSGGDIFQFPFSFVKNNCLMYDYKNRRVGASTSKIAV